MELNTLDDVKSFFDGFHIPEEQAEKLKLETAWRQPEPISNVRSRIAELAQAFAAAAAAVVTTAPQAQMNGQAGPSNAPIEPNQLPQESIQASAGPSPRTAVDAARDAVGAMANVLDGEGSPSKSGEGAQAPRISPLGAQIPATQQQQEQEEEPESSAGRRREAEEAQAMPPPPPLPSQQQQQQQQQQVLSQAEGGENHGFLLPAQPQHPSATQGTASMEIDEEEPENQEARGDDNNGGGGPSDSADIAQLPITQPIPYGGTLPQTLNDKVASVQEEARYAAEEAEEISPARGVTTAEVTAAVTGQQQEEDEEKREVIISPKAKRWFSTLNIFGKKQTPPSGKARDAAGAGGSASGSKKPVTPGFGSSPLGGRFDARGSLNEGLNTAERNPNSQVLLPTQVQTQISNENRDDEKKKGTTQQTVNINEDHDEEENLGEEEAEIGALAAGTAAGREGTQTMTENHEINPRDQHLATSIDARMDIGGGAGIAGSGGGGGGGGGEGAASPMRPSPFHQPSSVEAIDQEEDDGDVEEGGEVDEAIHGADEDPEAGGGGGIRRGFQTGIQRSPNGRFAHQTARRNTGPIVRRATSSVAQNGANAAAAAAAAVIAATAGGTNNLSAALVSGIGGLGGGPLTQDFYGVTATQEDIEAIIGGENGSPPEEEDAGDAIMQENEGEEEREPSAPPAEPSRGPGIAILKGRELSKNAAETVIGGIVGSEKEQEHDDDGGVEGADVQTSPEKPLRKSHRRGDEEEEEEEELSAGGGVGGLRQVPGIVYAKKRKMNPTEIVSKRLTRAQAAAAAAAEEAAAAAATAATGSTGVSAEYKTTEAIEQEEEEEELEADKADVYPSSSMPPPPIVSSYPALAAARDMPTPRAAPTPAAQLSSRTLAAREKLHYLMRQRRMHSAAPSAAGAGVGVPQPAGVYHYQPPANAGGGGGGLRIAVHRPGGGAVASGGGSGPNSNDYRTPMAGQTPVHSVHLGAGAGAAAGAAAAGGGGGARRGGAAGRAAQAPRSNQQQRHQPSNSAAGGTSAIWEGYLQRQQQRKQQQQQQQQSESAGGSKLSSLS